LPLLFIGLQLILFLCVFKLDSLKHSFTINDYTSAKAHLRKIYNADSDSEADAIFDEQRETFEQMKGDV